MHLGSPSIAGLIEHFRMLQPDKAALIDLESDEVLTFQDLASESAAYAAALFEAGIAPGARVILIMDNSIPAIVTWCALWRIGAVVCPMSAASMSTLAFRHALKQVHSQTCIFVNDLAENTNEILEVLAEGQVRIFNISLVLIENKELCIEAGNEALLGRALPFDQANNDDDLAAVCFTSGTSGTPKAVGHTHKSYRMNGYDSVYLLDFKSADKIIEYRPLSWFSAQILSFMPFLQLGLTLHLAQRFSLSRFTNWIDLYGISFAPGGPAILRLLIKHGIEKKGATLKSLRRMSCSSAPLMPGELAEIHQRLGMV